ncbi:MAG TPA: polysaccharide biosynthesis C-terminal domain-containing protein, partial [Candidatus Butyricicoccus avicola]|nr:polysaccharide biosynthesis C-terminal domain-containing protein [Candidatus Butyricicoccus avicola]
FVALVSLTNAVLQAAGRVRVPVISMLLGGVIKVLVNYTLVGTPQINIYGAPFGTLVCYAFITAVNLIILRKYVKLPGLGKLFIRPMAACLGMGAGAYIVYRLTSGVLGNTIGVILAICVAAVLYIVLLLALRALEKDDIRMMPKGEKLVRLLRLK